MSREAVVYEMTKRGNPVSVSTLLRWERDGSIKAEDAWHLSEVYGMTIDELLLSVASSGLGDPRSAREGSAGVASARAGARAAGKRQPRRAPRPPLA
jgi:transcriptional regulator with XRE-family HTH domain